MWWIETIRVNHGQFYRFSIRGWNDFNADTFSWSVPDLRGPYVFRLKEVR